jgi:hypothetical protein
MTCFPMRAKHLPRCPACFEGQVSKNNNMLEETVRNFESALEKGVLSIPTVLYQGLTDDYSDLIRNFLLDDGASIQPSTFQSVFTQQAIAHDAASSKTGMALVLKIHVPAGTHALALDQFPPHGSGIHEHEIILPRNTVYLVNSLYRSGGKMYADVNAETLNETPVEDMVPQKHTPKKVFTREQVLANPITVDNLASAKRPGSGRKRPDQNPFDGYMQIGPNHYIQVYPGPILDRRFTRVQMLGKSLTIDQYISQWRVYNSAEEALLGFLTLYKRDAEGYYVMVYPEPEIEPGDFELPASWS